jgi:putative heme-binding domain-containing protein
MALVSGDSPKARSAIARVEKILSHSSAVALDDKAPAARRLEAIGFLGYSDLATAGSTLESLLAPSHASEVQIAAVRALAQLPERAAAASLVDRDRWLAFTPDVREAVLSVLLTGERHIQVLLDALQTESIAATAVGPSRRNRLRNHRDAAIQARARALFAAVDAGDRMRVYERLRESALKRSGNPTNGKQLFDKFCATCHEFDGAGGQRPPQGAARLGPDLSGIRNQPAEAILLHVLVPDYEIAPGYQAYAVETRDGRTLVGRLESETPASLTLRDASSQSHVTLRSQVVSMAASPASLMPTEWERTMSEQDLADLIRYLNGHGNQNPPAR